MRKVILASASPRRKELFERAGIPFSIEESGYEENLNLKMKPQKLAEFLALEKAKKVANRHGEGIIIGADTIVVQNGEILGKPRDKKDAAKMLQKLSGRSHSVITGFAIVDASCGKKITRAETTKVHFKKLTDADISAYVASGEPLGKAGSYAIQGLGSKLVESMEGALNNVIGLPMEALFSELKHFGIKSYTRTH